MKKIFLFLLLTVLIFPQHVYWFNNAAGTFNNYNLTTSTPSTWGSSNIAYSATYQETGSFIFWTDFVAGRVKKSLHDGTGISTLVNAAGTIPRGIALDQVNSYLFYSDNYNNSITRTSLTGTGAFIVKNSLASPGNLFYDPVLQYLYYLDNGNGRKHIKRIHGDGTGDEVVVSGLTMVLSFTVDNVNNILYYIESANNTLYSVDLNAAMPGTKVSRMTGLPENTRGMAFRSATNTIFVSNTSTGMGKIQIPDFSYSILYNQANQISSAVFVTGNNPLPVELASFSAKIENFNVKLNFSTNNEVNNYGFEVERKSENTDWEKIGFVQGSGNSNSVKTYSFIDNKISVNGKYLYRLKQIDTDGSFEFSSEAEVNVSGLPVEFTLNQNYPNPFNPSTTITFSIPEDGFVSLRVYNVIGQETVTLINEAMTQGMHVVNFNAADLNSGVYYYKVKYTSAKGSFELTKKMSLVK